MSATYTSTLSSTQLAHPKHKQSQQQPSSSSTLKNDRPQNINGKDSQKHIEAMQNGHNDAEDQDSEDDAFDLGEGTSAAGPGLMARLNRDIAHDFADIASLLKDPLIWVNARFGNDASQKVPYEPLPSGPQKPTLNGRADLTFPKTPGAAVPATGLSPDQTVSSPGSTVNGKGKAAANNQNAAASAGPSSVPLPMSWPQSYPVGPGYHNLGNTCFLNSTLQALTHTPPLVACLMGDMHHSQARCKTAAMRRFCLLCAMQKHIQLCFRKGRSPGAMEPSLIVRNLPTIAKHMRVGRQEDAHEFLRFSIDHMQEAAAKNMSPPAKTDAEKEHTFMARIFGGKLRSRVACGNCKHNSDTFDGFMDLSLDVSRSDNVKEALQAFVKEDVLQGANKYKCEKCKKLVNARKHFTIEKAPQILHIHLKRFTPTGKKIGGAIGYQETLYLDSYMSDGTADRNPTYRLYAVVSHSGSGPHSGHYYAHVRSGQNRWHEMNDSTVRDVQPSQALSQRNAYMLFYERTNRLGDAVGKAKAQGGPNGVSQTLPSSPTGNALGKRKDREENDAAHPFPAQKVKYNHQSGPKTPYQQGRQNNGPYQQPSPISPNRKQNHHNRGGGQQKAANYFAQRGNNNANRPKMVAQMTGRPRH